MNNDQGDPNESVPCPDPDKPAVDTLDELEQFCLPVTPGTGKSWTFLGHLIIDLERDE